MRLEGGVPDPFAVHLFAESPDVLARHGPSDLPNGSPAPRGPEERRVRRHHVLRRDEHLLDIAMQKVHDGSWDGNIPNRSAFDQHASKPPVAVQLIDPQHGDRLASHPREAEKGEDRHVPHATAGLRRPDERVHDRRGRAAGLDPLLWRTIHPQDRVRRQEATLDQPIAEAGQCRLPAPRSTPPTIL